MTPGSKIVPLNDLAAYVRAERSAGRRVVHCHGVFDLLHIGHIRYLRTAAELGDRLVVTVTPNQHVNKGPHRPAFDELLRLDAVAALECVDRVALNTSPTAVEALEALRPSIYAKGAEYRQRKTPELLAEEALAARLGVEVRFVDEFTSSSSRLINEFLSPFPEQTDQYLRELRASGVSGQIDQWRERAARLRVLVVGEAIIDQFHFCSSLGQSAKAPVVAARSARQEQSAGGAVAVANHLAAFCGRTRLIAMVGRDDPANPWLRDQLHERVEAEWLEKDDAPTITKRRYIEEYFGSPLFEINTLDDAPLAGPLLERRARLVERAIAEVDLVVAADYGHGLIDDPLAQALSQGAPRLAVSVEANSANAGFTSLEKYGRIDYFSVAELELRLERRSRRAPVEDLLAAAMAAVSARSAAVTVGRRGCVCRRGETTLEAPSLATRVVDRHGAGDAFFALTALADATDAPLNLLAFLGNVAGAQAVATVGAPRLEPLVLARHIESLLK